MMAIGNVQRKVWYVGISSVVNGTQIFATGYAKADMVLDLETMFAQGEQQQVLAMELCCCGHRKILRNVVIFIVKITALEPASIVLKQSLALC